MSEIGKNRVGRNAKTGSIAPFLIFRLNGENAPHVATIADPAPLQDFQPISGSW